MPTLPPRIARAPFFPSGVQPPLPYYYFVICSYTICVNLPITKIFLLINKIDSGDFYATLGRISCTKYHVCSKSQFFNNPFYRASADRSIDISKISIEQVQEEAVTPKGGTRQEGGYLPAGLTGSVSQSVRAGNKDCILILDAVAAL